MTGSTPFSVFVRLAWVALALVSLTLLLAPFQIAATALNLNWKRKFPLYWHKIIRRVLRLTVTLEGNLSDNRPALIVANHQTWLDIVTLGSTFEASFIAKAEVRTWPGFSTLARLQRTVFVNRSRRSATGETANEIADRMIEGDAMILFAEGTTGDGNRVLPFKPALFGAAQMAEKVAHVELVTVQPVVVAYTHIRGSQVSRAERKRLSWYGDLELVPHILDYISMGPVEAKVICCEPMEMTAKSNRKVLSADCHMAITNAFSKVYHT